MVFLILLTVTILVLAAVFLQPKRGIFLLWPLLFCYPHYFMLQKQLLPLNAGIDDLFLCVFFLIVLVRRNMVEGKPMRVGYSAGYAILFALILCVLNLNSQFLAPGFLETQEYIKQSLKGVLVVFMAYAMVNSIDDLGDLRMLVLSFAFFVGVGALIVILQNFFPGPMSIFAGADFVENLRLGGEQRSYGAFMSANSGALLMAISFHIIVSTMRMRAWWFPRGLRFVMLGLLVAGILATRSRSGFLCLALPILMMCFFGQAKAYTWVAAITGLIAVVALPTMSDLLLERFTHQTKMGTGGFWEPIVERLNAIAQSWHSITLRRLILGQNDVVDTVMGFLPPHSAYLGLPLTYGLAGTAWAIAFFWLMVRKAKTLVRSREPGFAEIGWAIRWALVAFALYAFVGSFLGSYILRYTLFMLAVLAHRGVEILRQQTASGYAPFYASESYANGLRYGGPVPAFSR